MNAKTQLNGKTLTEMETFVSKLKRSKSKVSLLNLIKIEKERINNPNANCLIVRLSPKEAREYLEYHNSKK